MANLIKLSTIIEDEYNADFEKVKVAYWLITSLDAKRVYAKHTKTSKKGRRIAAERIAIEEDLFKQNELWSKCEC